MNRPVIIISAGAHARVALDTLMAIKQQVLGFSDPKAKGEIRGIPILGDDSAILKHTPDKVWLVNGLGTSLSLAKRRELFDQFKEKGYQFLTIVHPNAYVSADAKLAEGVQVMAGAIVQPGARIGNNAIINTGARVDHDCEIGEHSHIAPGAILCGTVQVGSTAHIGAGACVVENTKIGKGAFVAAGAVVTKDVAADLRVMGVPARAK